MQVTQIRGLLVEDNPGDAFLIKGMLSSGGNDFLNFQLTVVERLQDAIAVLKDEFFTVILLDLSLPDSLGLQTLYSLQLQDSGVPIIVLTGLEDEAIALQALQHGAQDYLIKKHLNRQLLVNTIRYSIERQQIEADLKHQALALATANQKLQKRTQELEIANNDLEAFNYTVSHDLRNPLAGIKMACSLLTSYVGQQEKPQIYLSTIQKYTDQINDTLEGLVQLSQISRNEIQSQSVNFSLMTQEVATQLQQTQPDRRVQFTIQPNVKAKGDYRLLRLAFENLIGNAWKYTGNCEVAHIEFGISDPLDLPLQNQALEELGHSQNHHSVYFVRDDGIGFDMQQAEQIFKPFQRLSGAQAFPGDGIGLASVKRIIQRHGGSLWCNAEVNKGATFYWTLGQNH